MPDQKYRTCRKEKTELRAFTILLVEIKIMSRERVQHIEMDICI